LGLQEQKLRGDQGRDVVVDRTGQEHDPLLKQPRVDVVGPFAPAGLLDHHRDQLADRLAHRFGLPPLSTDHAAPVPGEPSCYDPSSASGSAISSSGVTCCSVTLAICRMKSTTLSS